VCTILLVIGKTCPGLERKSTQAVPSKADIKFRNDVDIRMQVVTHDAVQKLDLSTIQSKVVSCPALPSLGSVSKDLRELLFAETSLSSQISEVIRRDPSLASRVLRLVNSVYYGMSTPVNNIEEAVFYLGVRQIRQLTMVTPIIEDFQKLTPGCSFPWRA